MWAEGRQEWRSRRDGGPAEAPQRPRVLRSPTQSDAAAPPSRARGDQTCGGFFSFKGTRSRRSGRVGNSTPRPERREEKLLQENQEAKGERGDGRGSGGEVEAGSGEVEAGSRR